MKTFKYGLPIPNIDPLIKGLEDLKLEFNPPKNTPVLNLYDLLSLNMDSSFDDYQNAIQNKYGFHSALSDQNSEFLPEEKRHIEYIIIPIEKLTNEKFMN